MDISERLAGLEARVQAVEAAQGIRNVVASYALAAFKRDEERWVGLFAEDGVLVQAKAGKEHAGKAELTRFFRKSLAPGFVTHQQAHNVHVEVDGNTARAESHWTVQYNAPDGAIKPMAGFYDDQFVKTEQGWRIKRRVIRDV